MTKTLILSTPRTGSNLLCECLTQTKGFGHVDALFVGYGEGMTEGYRERVDEWIEKHSAADGTFLTKMMWDYFDVIAQHTKYEGFRYLMDKFDRFIMLSRDDKTAQAVSWYMALRTGKWTSRGEFKKPMPSYDYHRIAWHMEQVAAFETRSRAFIEHSGLPWMAMTYEENVVNLETAVAKVGIFAGADYGDIKLDPKLQRQINPLKAEFITKFNEEFQKRENKEI